MKEDKTKGFLRITLIVMIGNLLTKVIGMLREVYLAKYYGAGMYTDAYIIANNIPSIIFGVVGVALASSFIPIYSEVNERDGKNEAVKFTSNLISILLVGCTIITIFGEVFTKQFISIFAMGFQGETLDYAIKFSRILMPCIFVMALMNVAGSFLQVNNDFKVIGYVSIPCNIIIILATIFSYKLENIYILIFGTLIGSFIQLVYYYPFIKRNGFKFKFRIDLKNKYIKQLSIVIIPVILGEAVNEVNRIVDKTLVSGLDTGSISALNYADKLIGVFTGVFVVSITTLIYPKLSKLIAENNNDEFNQILKKFINVITLMVIPIIAVILVLSPFIVKLVFERGTFDSESTKMTYEALNCYAIGLLGISMRDILIKVFYCLKDTKTPMVNGVICSFLNIPLSIILIKIIGYKGAALATSIVSIVCVLRLMYQITKKVEGIDFKDSMICIQKSLIAIIIPFVGLKFFFDYLMNFEINMILNVFILGIAVLVVLSIYVGLLILLKSKEALNCLNFIRRDGIRNEK